MGVQGLHCQRGGQDRSGENVTKQGRSAESVFGAVRCVSAVGQRRLVVHEVVLQLGCIIERFCILQSARGQPLPAVRASKTRFRGFAADYTQGKS